jgi:hypothetical protein
MGGCCEHGNDPSSSIKGEEFLKRLSNYKHLKNDCASWSVIQGLFRRCGERKILCSCRDSQPSAQPLARKLIGSDIEASQLHMVYVIILNDIWLERFETKT